MKISIRKRNISWLSRPRRNCPISVEARLIVIAVPSNAALLSKRRNYFRLEESKKIPMQKNRVEERRIRDDVFAGVSTISFSGRAF